MVGERTAAFGFYKSPVIRDGILTEGTGGGICQVASTLHAAALLAGLGIVERTPHSRPSSYIPMGLDATVVFPRVDLKVRNPWPYPIVVRAHAAHGELEVSWRSSTGSTRARPVSAESESVDAQSVEGEGQTADSPPIVTITIDIVEQRTFDKTVDRDASVPLNTMVVKVYGIPGYRIRRTRKVRLADGSLRQDFRFDVYPPVAESISVAPSFDMATFALHRQSAAEDTPALAPSAPTIAKRAATGVTRPAPQQLWPPRHLVFEYPPAP